MDNPTGYHGDPRHPFCTKFYYVVDAAEDAAPQQGARYSREQRMWIIQSDTPLDTLTSIEHYIVSYYMKVGW